MTTALVVVAVLAGLAFCYQFAWWRPTVDYGSPRILMYHMISRQKPKTRFNKLRVDPVEFERQLNWLTENGWTFVFMSQVNNEIPRRCVALTFDDGYRDNFLLADPILKKYGACATLYLVADRHDRDWSVSKKEHHSDGELKNEPKLLDSDVETMLQSGRWELGSHTNTHANLSTLDPAHQAEEIGGCREYLQNRFRSEIDSFAYPFGIYSASDVECVRGSGYSTAVTTQQGISQNVSAERFQLRRVKVSGQDGLLSFRLRMRTGKCRMRD